MKQKIKDLFRKACNKLFRKETHRTIYTDGNHSGYHSISPAWFRRQFEAAYPDAAKFIKTIKLLPMESRLPVFRLDNHIASYGSISINCKADDYSREVITHELSDALKEWSHAGNISRVSIDRSHKDGNFILQIIFRKDASGDKRADDILHID